MSTITRGDVRRLFPGATVIECPICHATRWRPVDADTVTCAGCDATGALDMLTNLETSTMATNNPEPTITDADRQLTMFPTTPEPDRFADLRQSLRDLADQSAAIHEEHATALRALAAMLDDVPRMLRSCANDSAQTVATIRGMLPIINMVATGELHIVDHTDGAWADGPCYGDDDDHVA